MKWKRIVQESGDENPTVVCPVCGEKDVEVDSKTLREWDIFDGSKIRIECHCPKCDQYYSVLFNVNLEKIDL